METNDIEMELKMENSMENPMENSQVSAEKKPDVKKLVVIFLFLLLFANLFATIMKNKNVVSRAEVEQIRTSVTSVQQELAAVKTSLEDLRKTSDSLARAEYEGFKAELGILSSLVEEMGKNIPQ